MAEIRRGGLTRSKNPALDLQRLTMEEMKHSPGSDEAVPSPTLSQPQPPNETQEQHQRDKATKQQSNKATYEETNNDSSKATKQQSDVADLIELPHNRDPIYKATKQQSNKGVRQQSNKVPVLETRLAAMRASAPFQLNARIPALMNEWLDSEAFMNRKAGVTKTSLLVRALELLIREVETEREQTEGK